MRRTSLLALALAAPAPALALTPDDVWSSWQAGTSGLAALFGAPGVALTAEESRGPDGSLALTGFALAMDGFAPEAPPPDFPIRTVTLRPRPDGSVLIDLGIPPGGLSASDATGEGRLDAPTLAIVARDDPEGIAYEVTADRLQAAWTIPDPYGAAPTDAAFEVQGLRMTFPGQIGPDNALALSLAATGYAYVGSSPDAFTGEVSDQSARVEGDMAMTLAATLPPSLFGAASFEAALLQALRDGLAVRADFTAGPSTQQQWAQGFATYQYSATSAASTAFVAADASRVAVGVEAGGGAVTAAVPDVPFLQDVEVSYGPFAFGLDLPLGPEAADWSYRASLNDLAIGDATWALLDPQGQLPRDPLRLNLDLGGRATLDLARALAAESKGQVGPTPSIDSLDIRAFEFSGLGLDATASGSFTFDNSTGVPTPVGTATARVEGLDRLIDALVALGVVTDEDARNARLGLAAVFRAGDGPDVRVTAIEARADGTILFNGLPLPF